MKNGVGPSVNLEVQMTLPWGWVGGYQEWTERMT